MGFVNQGVEIQYLYRTFRGFRSFSASLFDRAQPPVIVPGEGRARAALHIRYRNFRIARMISGSELSPRISFSMMRQSVRMGAHSP
jgi:hypothetical protein